MKHTSFYEARRLWEVGYFKGLLEKHEGRIVEVSKDAGMDRRNCRHKLESLGLRDGIDDSPRS